MERTWQGGCHCGAVRFEVATDLARIVDCNCSICAKKGFLHLIVAPEKFRLLQGEDALVTYRFNTGTARHTFCGRCGIHAFYTPRSHPDQVDVNVRCIEGIDLAALTIVPFDGQNWEAARSMLD
jgi:hypothetical protein